MTLSAQAREYMAKRDGLSTNERFLIDRLFNELYNGAKYFDIPAATDDRAAELEGAIIKFIIYSREG